MRIVTQQAALQQVTTMAVTVMSLNMFAQALGILVASAALTKAPTKQTATERGIAELREAYGSRIVDKALAEVPSKDIVELARKIDALIHAEMVAEYGEWATEAAEKAAPPGDLRTARQIAQVLSGKGITPATPAATAATVTEKAKKRALAGRKPGKRVKDMKTNLVYQSHYAAGKAVAAEYGLDPEDHHVWFEVLKRDPGRFKDVE